MHDEQARTNARGATDGLSGSDRPRLSRRQAMGRMSMMAGAGAAAWVVPEILMAKPAAGAALSGTSTGGSVGVSGGVSTSASTGGSGSGDPAGASVGASGTVGTNGPDGVATAAETTGAVDPTGSLAFTGLDIQRDAEVGAALVAGGWAMQHWASRTPKPERAGTTG